MSQRTLVTAVAIDHDNPISLQALAHACGVEVDWVIQLVDVGIVEAQSPATQLQNWCFYSADLQKALEARKLECDFGVGLEAAALILDLQNELRRLKAALQARGL